MSELVSIGRRLTLQEAQQSPCTAAIAAALAATLPVPDDTVRPHADRTD